ncbi:MAG TPA: hypothetical protein DIS53_01275 [Candidatus Wildermuthbacteria bacterium]|nr:MAG: Sensor protein resE [Parcubacteria group bacterium GW2011_GWB1_49_12]KKW08874.1 MAG: Sensor protein resE [Parcubacteria group bacterium GW2011_GWA1_49_26]KKW13728.1 MAG: Sensor protein resE [Parcubacteria group bacterium GW2011_GWA2_50_10]OHA72218.1 MAG: hypothetical protein A3E08_03175 [Candidatus Wildermuthbacteria bacterium RIFCSPHIGHO2_12_FULL_49_13]OHA78097.1 MAG: hypothetical protein A2564_00485 [Candidatus Wildermuthbacteria bacterium RIFOXYD1_FULL_50_12]HCM36549.1 hypothetical 
MQLRLRTKLILFGLTFAILPLGAAMSSSILRFYDTQRHAAVERQARIAKSTAQEIANFLAIQFLRAQEVVLLQPELMQDGVVRSIVMEQLLFKNDSFVDLSLINADGQEIARKHRYRVIREDDLRDLSASEVFQAARQRKAYLSDVYFDQGRPLFLIGDGIYNRRNELQGVALAEVDARIMQQVVSETTIAQEGGRAYIVNADGIVVAHPDISTVLARRDLSFLPIVAALKLAPAETSATVYQNELGEDMLGFWAPIVVQLDDPTETLWYVIAEENASLAFRRAREVVWFSFVALVLAGVLAVGGALFISRRIVMPIEVIQRLAMRIGKGDFGQRVTVHTHDEIEELARGFNQMAERLLEGKERNEQVSRMKSEFLAITAHQLRTPLSASKWVLRMILDGDVGPLKKPQKELLEKGYMVNERMITLVNDLLDVVRIEEGKFEYAFKKGAISGIIEDVAKETKAVADKKGIRLSFHKPAQELPQVALDAQKFRLAVSNIVDNAVRYTKEGGRVDIELTFHDDEILVLVKDTGIGIPKKWLDRVFTKFFRADNAVKMQTDGSGLGLFIAKNIIEKHGGRIWFESEEGKGTTVYFTVPVREKASRTNRIS